MDGIQLITKVKNKMRSSLRSIADKILLRKCASIETINDELKNITQKNTQDIVPPTTSLQMLYLQLQPTVLLTRDLLMWNSSKTGNLLRFELYRTDISLIFHILFLMFCESTVAAITFNITALKPCLISSTCLKYSQVLLKM